jgi:hypothetical protein
MRLDKEPQRMARNNNGFITRLERSKLVNRSRSAGHNHQEQHRVDSTYVVD